MHPVFYAYIAGILLGIAIVLPDFIETVKYHYNAGKDDDDD